MKYSGVTFTVCFAALFYRPMVAEEGRDREGHLMAEAEKDI
jgi:hypothetical protein